MKNLYQNLLPLLGLGLLLAATSCDNSANDNPPQPDSVIVLTDDNATTNMNTAVTFNILSNDTISGQFTITMGAPQNGTITPANSGTVTPGTAGTYTYTPNAGFSGTDQFTYIVCKGTTCDTATITITVVNTTTPCQLTASSDQATTSVNTAVTISPLTNDQTCGTVTISLPAAIANGTATVSGTTVVFTPATGYSGTTTFAYQISNSNGSATSTIQVTVNPAPPVNPCGTPTTLHTVIARADTAFTTGTTALIVVDIPVLSNDTYCTGNTTAMTWVVTIVQNPTLGTATVMTVNGQRIIRYTTSTPPVATDQLRYKLCNTINGQTVCDEANVIVHINQ